MVVQVIGYKKVSYKRKTDGRQVDGAELYYIWPPAEDDEQIIGNGATSVWLGTNFLPMIESGKINPGVFLDMKYEFNPGTGRSYLASIDVAKNQTSFF